MIKLECQPCDVDLDLGHEGPDLIASSAASFLIAGCGGHVSIPRRVLTSLRATTGSTRCHRTVTVSIPRRVLTSLRDVRRSYDQALHPNVSIPRRVLTSLRA